MSFLGDRLSLTVKNLLPKATYYFKIQARNVKGYGPLSPVVTFFPDTIFLYGNTNTRQKYEDMMSRKHNYFYVQLDQLLAYVFLDLK